MQVPAGSATQIAQIDPGNRPKCFPQTTVAHLSLLWYKRDMGDIGIIKLIGYTLTTPWHNLKIAAQQVLDTRNHVAQPAPQVAAPTEEEKAWVANKKAEYNGVTVVVGS